MRWTRVGGAALALVLATAACGLAPDQGGRAAAGTQGEGVATPSGQIVFVSDRVTGSGYNLEIFSMNADGSDQTRLTDNHGHDHQPAWSPDGTEIAFASGQEGADMSAILLMKADGSEPRTLIEGWRHVGVPRWSPEGDRLAVAGDRGDGTQIYVVDTASGDITQVTDEPDPTGVGGAYQPDWSPDGRRIVHMRVRFDDQQESSSELYVMNADGSDVTLLPTGASTESGPRWSPDGSKVAFVSGRDGATEIYVMNIDGTSLARVTDHPGDDFTPSWSRDGSRIAFASSRDGDAEIYVANFDGTDVTQVRDNGWDDTNPDWIVVEPDGQASAVPSPDESKYVGFYPASRLENGQMVMPLTFLDGSTAEIVSPAALGLQDMRAQIFTGGGLGGVDRTIDFRYEDDSIFTNEGPLEVHPGADGSDVELWQPAPDFDSADCSYLVYRFGDWYVGVRACQSELSDSEKAEWARSLIGHQTDDRFLVLDALPPLVLVTAGGHEGPEVMLYDANSFHPMIRLKPGRCDPEKPSEGDIRTMDDGTKVSFNRIGRKPGQVEDGGSGNEDDWFVSWCEDGLMRVQVGYAYEDFATAAAESLRLRDIALAE